MFQASENTKFMLPIWKETVKVNKLAFDAAYSWASVMQDQMEGIAGILLKGWMPGTESQHPGKGPAVVSSMKEEREKFKMTIDLGFEALEGMWGPGQTEAMSKNAETKVKEAQSITETVKKTRKTTPKPRKAREAR